jgi:hypothetical protein
LLRRVRRGVLARHQKWWEWWYPSLDERMKFGERSGIKSVRLNVRMMPKERERGWEEINIYILIWKIGRDNSS